ncbi:MAG: pantoate--beta-alanine ligase [Actinomycetota bacterium]|nr:pantoate--beta-alanine ligase [Actinomycetota bacterium]
MKVVRSARELRSTLAPKRLGGRTIGLVPTMGALHDGHLSLVRLARERCDVVVVSVFVNPRQFGKGEDYDRYPRDAEGDLELLQSEGADVAFLPGVDEMYPPEATVGVMVGRLGEVFEGAARPGHFDGVVTVVTKLFNIVEPYVAVFGQKDAQQVAVLKRLIRDLDFPVDLLVGRIVREGDGLAISSRNAFLSSEQRVDALALSRALEMGRSTYVPSGDPRAAAEVMAKHLEEANGVKPSYADAVHPDTFEAVAQDGPALLIVAAEVGTTRLIDNLLIEPDDIERN